jgi:predicted membrane metal-binding protein
MNKYTIRLVGLFIMGLSCIFSYELGVRKQQRQFPLLFFIQDVHVTCSMIDKIREGEDNAALQIGCMRVIDQIKQLNLIVRHAPRESDRDAAFGELMSILDKRKNYEMRPGSKDAEEIQGILDDVGRMRANNKGIGKVNM